MPTSVTWDGFHAWECQAPGLTAPVLPERCDWRSKICIYADLACAPARRKAGASKYCYKLRSPVHTAGLCHAVGVVERLPVTA